MREITNLSKLFPNIKIYNNGNILTLEIPKYDIVNLILNNVNPQIKNNIRVEFYPDGILIKIVDLGKLFSNFIYISNNVNVEPNEIKIFIPKEDIINSFRNEFNNANVMYNENGIIIEVQI